MKRLWLVRLGKFGEQEAHALETGELVLGFKIGELPGAKDRDAVLALVQKSFPNAIPKRQLHIAAQLNQFGNTMQSGDLVIVPLKTTGSIAIGELVGDCKATADGFPRRRVTWVAKELPRETFKQDLLYSFGAFMTVCEIRRNDALRRVETVIRTGRDPGFEGLTSAKRPSSSVTAEEVPDEDEAGVDLEQIARDQIKRKLASEFTGHNLTRLVAEILKAQGYVVNVSPPGADQGVDIVAGRGALGLEGPRLVVQVKSGDITADQPTLQALIGAVQDTHADHGLLVSWGGFKKTVTQRRNELFFRIRLWGAEDLLSALFDTYERLPEEFRAELPLRRVWMLVPEEDSDSS